MKEILQRIAEHESLSRTDAERAMELLLDGRASPEQIAGLLLGLRARGETVEELTGFTHVMRAHAVHVDKPHDDVLDIVGTGGDGARTFNISTAAALVCAGTGAVVAKHGNRSVSSRCGASEVLEALGVRTHLGREGVEFCLEQAGIAFLYAPFFHPAMANVMPVRRALGVRTCFNILGPMCNPAGVTRYAVGAFSLQLAESMASILMNLGARSLVTVHSEDGLDEVSISAPTTLFVKTEDASELQRMTLAPEDLGLERAPIRDVAGGDAAENAEILRAVVQGQIGPRRDIVLMNAAVGLRAAGLAASFAEGVRMAAESIDSGNAAARLRALADASQAAPRPESEQTSSRPARTGNSGGMSSANEG